MKKNTQIILSRQDIINFCRSQGLTIDANFQVETCYGYEPEADCITITYEERCLVPYRGPDVRLPEHQFTELQTIFRTQTYPKIAMIKKLREFTGWGLADSKAWIEGAFAFPR